MSTTRITAGTVVKLALASLLVGLLLAALGFTPVGLLEHAVAAVTAAWSFAQDFLGWAGSYMLLGALVVLPIWLVRHFSGRARAE